ncbi:hypothetical protein DFP72DRAFT_1138347 [Ephemerocybe angulata]|uniref:Uncharacterized protein n=1 Tax=Ephemerocybe angulata TaxID=980116 RepID=A0A8H6HSC8_9AGAR|nr:hypothetical protein DFP72DRAFT_1138347 [Tulosesus angulatus]
MDSDDHSALDISPGPNHNDWATSDDSPFVQLEQASAGHATVIEEMLLFGDVISAEECADLFYNEAVSKSSLMYSLMVIRLANDIIELLEHKHEKGAESSDNKIFVQETSSIISRLKKRLTQNVAATLVHCTVYSKVIGEEDLGNILPVSGPFTVPTWLERCKKEVEKLDEDEGLEDWDYLELGTFLDNLVYTLKSKALRTS